MFLQKKYWLLVMEMLSIGFKFKNAVKSDILCNLAWNSLFIENNFDLLGSLNYTYFEGTIIA